jgi:hypothetical protein
MKTINFNGKLLEYKISFRAMIDFQRDRGKSADDIETLEDGTYLMFCAVRQEAKKQDVEFSLGFEDFIDWLDQNPGALQGFEKEKPGKEKKKDTEKKS